MPLPGGQVDQGSRIPAQNLAGHAWEVKIQCSLLSLSLEIGLENLEVFFVFCDSDDQSACEAACIGRHNWRAYRREAQFAYLRAPYTVGVQLILWAFKLWARTS